jgi:hypothetical protein
MRLARVGTRPQAARRALEEVVVSAKAAQAGRAGESGRVRAEAQVWEVRHRQEAEASHQQAARSHQAVAGARLEDRAL